MWLLQAVLYLILVVFGGRDGVSVLIPGDKRRDRPPLRHAAKTEVFLAGILLHGVELRRPLKWPATKILSETFLIIFHIDPQNYNKKFYHGLFQAQNFVS